MEGKKSSGSSKHPAIKLKESYEEPMGSEGISLHDDMILTVRGVAPQDLDSDGGGWLEDLRAVVSLSYSSGSAFLMEARGSNNQPRADSSLFCLFAATKANGK
ncbi:hypothetical protein SDJN03_27397, partial [Cucurbita argyrosperma subsp. sororia]